MAAPSGDFLGAVHFPSGSLALASVYPSLSANSFDTDLFVNRT